jgi:hypothetical protein
MALGLACLFVLTAPLSASAAPWSSSSLGSQPRSTLTADLGGGTWSELTRKFDARLRQRFPLGVPESVLTRELAQQGFDRVAWRGPDGTEAVAERHEGDFACDIAARVYWRADAAGHVRSLRGEYREAGCL